MIPEAFLGHDPFNPFLPSFVGIRMLKDPLEAQHRIREDIDFARCDQTQSETNTGIQLSAISLAIPFAIHYAGFVLSRFTVRPEGRTPLQYLLRTPCVYLCACLVNQYLTWSPILKYGQSSWRTDGSVVSGGDWMHRPTNTWWGRNTVCFSADQSAETSWKAVELTWKHLKLEGRRGILTCKRTL